MGFIDSHILSFMTFLPLLGAAVILCVPKGKDETIKWIAALASFLPLLLSVRLWFTYDRTLAGVNVASQFQFVEHYSWIPSINVEYFVGADGISMPMLLLTALLSFLAVIGSWGIDKKIRGYMALFLLLETGMMGTFISLDFFLFYVFWEVMLVPMYLLIGIWGGPRKLYAAIKFFLYTLVGSVAMLLGILYLYFHHHKLTGIYTFSVEALYKTSPLIDPSIAVWLFLGFFLAFAIKVPMFPFHTWLPDAHTEAPTAGSVILAGVLLKMGTYGLIRFSLPLFPAIVQDEMMRGAMMTLSIIAILYGALVTLMQKDMKRLIAYSSVSHLGFCTLGIFALNPLGLAGSVLQQINHGISTGALFLIVGILYERRHSREISEYGGISNVMPVYAAITLIMFMSSLGLPLLNGFIGEFTILQGTFMEANIAGHSGLFWAAWASGGVVLGAAYLLWLYQRVFFGPVTNPKNEKLADLTPRELVTFIPLVILAFVIGIYPKPFFQILEQPVNQIVKTVRPNYPVNAPSLSVAAADEKGKR